MSRAARVLTLLGFATIGCVDRPPPPGSGAIETTPTASAAKTTSTALSAGPRALSCPNGSVVTTDAKTCRLALLRDGIVRWDRELSGCGGVLEATVAMDSSVYARTPKALSSFTPDGALSWANKLEDPTVSRHLAAPSSLPDSRVAVLASKKSLVVYEKDGKVSWTFSPPSEEEIVAPPEGMKTEGIVLLTSQAAYYLGATGEIRWRVANSSPVAAP